MDIDQQYKLSMEYAHKLEDLSMEFYEGFKKVAQEYEDKGLGTPMVKNLTMFVVTRLYESFAKVLTREVENLKQFNKFLDETGLKETFDGIKPNDFNQE